MAPREPLPWKAFRDGYNQAMSGWLSGASFPTPTGRPFAVLHGNHPGWPCPGSTTHDFTWWHLLLFNAAFGMIFAAVLLSLEQKVGGMPSS